MIQCTTQPYPFAEEGRNSGWMRVMVTINGTQYDSHRNFIYRWSYTPRVSTCTRVFCIALPYMATLSTHPVCFTY